MQVVGERVEVFVGRSSSAGHSVLGMVEQAGQRGSKQPRGWIPESVLCQCSKSTRPRGKPTKYFFKLAEVGVVS
jgi:hypothetical protein